MGKSTLINRLMGEEEFEDRLKFCVSHTTRAPREGEEDGVAYHFTERRRMEQLIQKEMFLEHAEVHGNLYGTSLASIAEAQAGDRVCVLDIDLAGVGSLRQELTAGKLLGCKARFVLVTAEGGIDTLEARLRSRNSETEESIRLRMQTARREMEEYRSHQWDASVVNRHGDIERGAAQLREVIRDLRREEGRAGAGPVEAPDGLLAASAVVGVKEPVLEVISPTNKSVFGEMSALARELGSDGVDLGQGFPNFDPPDFVVQALRDELETMTDGGPQTRHQYTRTAGHPAFVEVIADRYSRHLGRDIDPMSEVAVSVGATGGLYLSLQTILSLSGPDAREIVALEPFFELYRAQASGLGATLKTVPLAWDDGERSFSLDAEALRKAIGPHTAALIVNTPHNPTGKAFTEEELLAVADIVRENPHVTVISDEVYKFMIYDPPGGVGEDPNRPWGHTHFAKLPDMWKQTITVSSAGKTFGITGWQIGWVIGPKEYLAPIHKFMPNLQFCAPTLMQRALKRVFDEAAKPVWGQPSYYQWLREDYRKRRELMVSALENVGIATAKSQGGFFLLGDIGDLCGEDGPLGNSWRASIRPDEPRDWTFCRALAAEIGMVALPVSPFFGPDAPSGVRTRFARFCFAKTFATLEEAERRLQGLSRSRREGGPPTCQVLP